jgi:serine/threonine-protein kinase
MSPEQEAGTAVDARSDLFALGAVLYECLAGEPPPPQTPSGPVRMDASPVARFDSGTQKAAAFLPPAWRTIIEKAMAADPEGRFQDARSFAQALRCVHDDDDVQARGSS